MAERVCLYILNDQLNYSFIVRNGFNEIKMNNENNDLNNQTFYF